MFNKVSRDIIADYMNFDGLNKHDLCMLINRWKRLLVTKYAAKKGTSIGVGIFNITPDHLALIFAAAEIGMELMVLTKPVSMETIAGTKQAQLGLPDMLVMDVQDTYFWPESMLDFYRTNNVCVIRNDEIEEVLDETDIECDPVYPSDTYFVTSTSGSTTGEVKKIAMSHETIMKWAHIPARIRLSRETTMMHNVNMHHSAALTAAVLPALMVVENNYYGLINIGTEEEFVLDYVIGRGVKSIMANNMFQIERLIPHIERHKDKFTHKLEIFIAGFKAPDILYDYAKNLPVYFWTSYGTTEQGLLAWFIIDDTTENIPGYVGELVDWVSIDFIDGIAYASSDYLEFYNSKIADRLELKGNNVYFRGRLDALEIENSDLKLLLDEQCDYSYIQSSKTDRKYIVIWDLDEGKFLYTGELKRGCDAFYFLSKEKFTIENKLAYGELLMYLDNRYETENR